MSKPAQIKGFRKEEISAFVLTVEWEQTENILPMSEEELDEFCKENVSDSN